MLQAGNPIINPKLFFTLVYNFGYLRIISCRQSRFFDSNTETVRAMTCIVRGLFHCHLLYVDRLIEKGNRLFIKIMTFFKPNIAKKDY